MWRWKKETPQLLLPLPSHPSQSLLLAELEIDNHKGLLSEVMDEWDVERQRAPGRGNSLSKHSGREKHCYWPGSNSTPKVVQMKHSSETKSLKSYRVNYFLQSHPWLLWGPIVQNNGHGIIKKSQKPVNSLWETLHVNESFE